MSVLLMLGPWICSLKKKKKSWTTTQCVTGVHRRTALDLRLFFFFFFLLIRVNDCESDFIIGYSWLTRVVVVVPDAHPIFLLLNTVAYRVVFFPVLTALFPFVCLFCCFIRWSTEVSEADQLVSSSEVYKFATPFSLARCSLHRRDASSLLL
jgi:hypothetical protein